MPSTWSISTPDPITSNSRGTTLIFTRRRLEIRMTSSSRSCWALENATITRSTSASRQTRSKSDSEPRHGRSPIASACSAIAVGVHVADEFAAVLGMALDLARHQRRDLARRRRAAGARASCAGARAARAAKRSAGVRTSAASHQTTTCVRWIVTPGTSGPSRNASDAPSDSEWKSLGSSLSVEWWTRLASRSYSRSDLFEHDPQRQRDEQHEVVRDRVRAAAPAATARRRRRAARARRPRRARGGASSRAAASRRWRRAGPSRRRARTSASARRRARARAGRSGVTARAFLERMLLPRRAWRDGDVTHSPTPAVERASRSLAKAPPGCPN